MMLTRRRKEVVSSAGDRVLDAFVGMLVVWGMQLHQHGLKLQPSTSTCPDRLEDTDRIYSSCSSDCSHLHFVIIDECTKSVDATLHLCNSNVLSNRPY